MTIERGDFTRAVILVGMTLLMGGCGEGAPTTPEQPNPATATWHLRIAADSDIQPGSLLLALEGTVGTPSVLAPDDLFSRVSLGSEVRVLLAGTLSGRGLVEVRGGAIGVAPSARVLGAAAGGTGGYAQLDPSSVRLEWVAVD